MIEHEAKKLEIKSEQVLIETVPLLEYLMNLDMLDKSSEHLLELILADSRVNPNQSHEGIGNTMLHFACDNGWMAGVELLLKHPKIDQNVLDLQGCTPLMLACDFGQLDVVARLLEDPKVDTNAVDHEGISALMYACMKNHSSIIEYCLKSDRFGWHPSSDSISLLHHACQEGYKEIASLLLEDGRTDPNLTDKHGLTPLHYTFLHGHQELRKLLMEHPRVHITPLPENLIALDVGEQKIDAETVKTIKRALIEGIQYKKPVSYRTASQGLRMAAADGDLPSARVYVKQIVKRSQALKKQHHS